MTVSILGKNLKKIREEKKISAYKLAKISGVGAATISQIESGKRQSLNSASVEKIAIALGIEVNDLFNTDDGEEIIVTDIEQTINLILTSDELILDDISLSNSEKEQLRLMFNSAINAIRIQRGR